MLKKTKFANALQAGKANINTNIRLGKEESLLTPGLESSGINWPSSYVLEECYHFEEQEWASIREAHLLFNPFNF